MGMPPIPRCGCDAAMDRMSLWERKVAAKTSVSSPRLSSPRTPRRIKIWTLRYDRAVLGRAAILDR
jgi:hypothetical protein